MPETTLARETKAVFYSPIAEELLNVLKNAPVINAGYLKVSLKPWKPNEALPGLLCEYGIKPDNGKIWLDRFGICPAILEREEIDSIYKGGKPARIHVSIPHMSGYDTYKDTKTAFLCFRQELDRMVSNGYAPFMIELGYYPVEFHDYSVETGIVLSNKDRDPRKMLSPGKALFLDVADGFADKPETKELEKLLASMRTVRD
jgi:hypothetical protein